MQEEAYAELQALQSHHWWYAGARAVYRVLLKIGLDSSDPPGRMLDIGCGPGGNLSLLSEYGPTVGVELSLHALRLIDQPPGIGLVQASATALPFASGSFHGVHLLGVIEHLEDDEQALREAARVCQPGGAIMLLTSAFPILWSHHDEANFHKQRYMRRQFTELLYRAGLSPLRISYQNCVTFFPTLLVRLVQRMFSSRPRYDMGTSQPFLNAILIYLLQMEAWFIQRIDLPFGVDLVAVCRKDVQKSNFSHHP